MQITLNLPHVFQEPLSDEVSDDYALNALLDCMVKLNLAALRAHAFPSLYESGVRYGRTKIWEPIPALYSRQRGDCKSLSPARVAELYVHHGIQARCVFRGDPKETHTDWHILVQIPRDPSLVGVMGLTREDVARGYEDPSKKLGMLKDPSGRFFYDTFGSELVNPVRSFLGV